MGVVGACVRGNEAKNFDFVDNYSTVSSPTGTYMGTYWTFTSNCGLVKIPHHRLNACLFPLLNHTCRRFHLSEFLCMARQYALGPAYRCVIQSTLEKPYT